MFANNIAPVMPQQELNYLYGLFRQGVKLDLSVTREFSRLLGQPENDFRTLHVAGTNGKGSTVSMLHNILMRKHRSGMYTSPHLVKFNERIIAERDQISDRELVEFVQDNKGLIEKLALENRHPTFFEATTVLAFQHFARKKLDYACVEVGLGGRLDSTNIVTPEVSVITQVGYEHADKLGCSLTSIAGEKAGIVKEGIPVVLGDYKREVVDTVRRIAQSRNSEFVHAPSQTEISDIESDLGGTRFKLGTPKSEYRIDLRMLGEFQPSNVACAVLAIENSNAGNITKNDIEAGIRNSRWPGRMDIIRKDPVVMVDGAHNPPAANALRISLKELGIREPTLLLGMLSDKDAFTFLRIMREISGKAVFTAPDEPYRAIPAQKLNEISGGIFRDTKTISDPIQAYEAAKSDSDFVVVAGSLYLAGTIMEHEKASVMPFSKP